MKQKYIDEWYNATIAHTRTGEHGTINICTNDLICGEEAAKRQNEVLSKTVHDALYYQAVRKSKNQKDGKIN